MSASAEAGSPAKESTGGKKKMIMLILVAILSIGAGVGGTWYFMQSQQGEEDEEPKKKKKKKPTEFIKFEPFTVNLQPEEDGERHYLQVEISLKVNQTEVVGIIKEKMPEIRNKALLVLSSKKASEIFTLEGKQQLGKVIVEEIQLIVGDEDFNEDIKETLFNSFIIQ
ncbi:MAG TPA: flagellar basal body-associated protein FliL [Nitrosomonas sp.]|nr:flagellar basal body-associated protein FliL [Nitrosomonas sp.]HMW21680.1 flagellar basal body-associated protein FliL [Nitrosomonas sp.]HMW69815.1 flagellar basal body-associated protein FliL [Nitrosomonas sp.]HMY61837.1 flagellar basal body-associated protein FliL [Nitrosomonas sp.]HMY90949.1 flagellar basal body-associated protein FliL [Nitrosomonas sp.]